MWKKKKNEVERDLINPEAESAMPSLGPAYIETYFHGVNNQTVKILQSMHEAVSCYGGWWLVHLVRHSIPM